MGMEMKEIITAQGRSKKEDNRKCLSLYQIVTCKTVCDRQKSSDLPRSVETVYKTE
jgi:hypothetical protein